ncbi:uncharacterized protein LOC124541007 [Vanessa cardui]|uniref:uncharacterized protein LOC124541007 n=1 Tax=Vanessa cardui TaxID=171605 RepID=UPI001F12DA4E|nr:uncharacterized protein LOC124541007 [Vanessa cardui]
MKPSSSSAFTSITTEMEKLLIFFCFATFQIPDVISQCLNRQPQNIVFNRQLPETIIETPLNNPLSYQQTVIENSNLPIFPQLASASPTTIITDCTPSVCQNLVNTLQLMIVSNLLKNTKGGSELAAQLASPIIGEALSSPAFSCGCPERFLPNTVPNIISPGINFPNLYPGLINSNIIPGTPVFQGPGVANANNNAFIGNILGMLGN